MRLMIMTFALCVATLLAAAPVSAGALQGPAMVSAVDKATAGEAVVQDIRHRRYGFGLSYGYGAPYYGYYSYRPRYYYQPYAYYYPAPQYYGYYYEPRSKYKKYKRKHRDWDDDDWDD